MSDCCCGPAIRHFDQTIAEQDLARYRRKGLEKRARLLLESIRRSGLSGRSVLEVGSGVGTLSLELLKAGATHATLADASPAYLGVTYPRARVDVRLVFAIENLRRRLKGDAFRAFVHPPAAIQADLRAGGWRLLSRGGTFAWRVELYARE